MLEEQGLEAVAHDDALIFRGQKHEVRLAKDWRKRTHKVGPVLGYFHPATNQRIGPDDPPKGDEWKPMQARSAPLAKGVSFFAELAYIDIRLNSLWEDLRARYRVGLDAVVRASDRGLIHYAARSSTAGDPARNQREAIRNRFKRHFHAVAYEHDLLIRRDVGRAIIEEIRAARKCMAGGKYPNTVYLKGFDKKGSIKIKIYDMAERDGTDAVKIEVTLRQDYLDRHGLKPPQVWEDQPDIQDRLVGTLKTEWGRVFDAAPRGAAMLSERLDIRPRHLTEHLADRRHTLAEVIARQDALEAAQAADRAAQADLERRLTADRADLERRLTALENRAK